MKYQGLMQQKVLSVMLMQIGLGHGRTVPPTILYCLTAALDTSSHILVALLFGVQSYKPSLHLAQPKLSILHCLLHFDYHYEPIDGNERV